MLNSFLDLYEILNTTLESATEAMKADACSILLLDEKTGKLEYLPPPSMVNVKTRKCSQQYRRFDDLEKLLIGFFRISSCNRESSDSEEALRFPVVIK